MSRKANAQKILFFKIGALGDVLMTTPLIHAVRNAYPDAQIDYLVGKWSAPALAHNPDISRVLTFSDRPGVWGMISVLLPVVARLFLRYDTVIVLDKAWQLTIVGRLLGRRCIGFNRNGEGVFLSQSITYDANATRGAVHDIEYYLMLGKLIGGSKSNVAMHLFYSDADMRTAHELLDGLTGKIITLCPGGARNPYQVMDARRWPKERYAQLALCLLEKGMSVILLGASSDSDEGEYIMQACMAAGYGADHIRNLIGTTSFLESAACISQCVAVVSHDTSLMHAASAMNVPVIALFGPTNPARKRPLNTGSRVLYHAGMCPSCGRTVCHWEYRNIQLGCQVRMNSISVEEVIDAVDQIVATNAA